ncbi:DUF6461 domain-containing protein [Micromonospora sp. NPDC049559]|uniref:DUF6461 domain-containing protein n=1 Tax=Micromonospora sp. NPDC049559 TaxID=3155923 RepID=UPI00343388EC
MIDDPWAWAVDGRRVSFCLTFISGRDPAQVITTLGGDPDRLTLYTELEAYQQGRPNTIIRCGTVGTWTFCYEDSAGATATPATAARLSEGTELLQVIKGGDGTNVIVHARNGRRVEWTEPLRSFQPSGKGPHPLHSAVQAQMRREPEVLGLVAALHLIADYVGGHITEADLEGPLLGVVVSLTGLEWQLCG